MKLVLKKWDIKSQNKLKYNQFNALMDTHNKVLELMKKREHSIEKRIKLESKLKFSTTAILQVDTSIKIVYL